jgi:hypothetical protein
MGQDMYRDNARPEYQSQLPLEGIDGNAFSIAAQVMKGLRLAGAPKEYRDQVQRELFAGDYDHLLTVAILYTDADYLMEDDNR